MALVVITIALSLRGYLQAQNAKLDRITSGLDFTSEGQKEVAIEDRIEENELSLEQSLMAKSNFRYLL